MRWLIILLPLIIYLSGCASNNTLVQEKPNELKKFAYANCLMWYLESKGYDTEDVRSISGGIVETSNISLDKFQEIALIVKEYQPEIETKNNIDINLLKCFYLEESAELNKVSVK